MKILVETDSVRLSLLGTGTDTLFVAFTGVGQGLGGIQTEEFIGTASRGNKSALFVIDKKRSWYNEPDVMSEALFHYKRIRTELNARRTVALGNSMGGFGAILFSGLANIDAAIAFSPQFSVHPDIVPQENRWKEYRKQIGRFLYKDLSSSFRHETRYYIFNGDAPEEEMHFSHFPQRPNVTNIVFPGCYHEVARMLKTDARLSELISLCAEGATAAVQALCVQRYGAYVHAPPQYPTELAR